MRIRSYFRSKTAQITTSIRREVMDTIHFIRHDKSVEARLYYAIVVIFAVAAAAQMLVAILQAIGILQITTTTTALISH